MSTISTAITTIASTDTISASRSTINTNTTLRHSMNVRAIADADSPYTWQEGDDCVLVTSTAAIVTLNLPAAASAANRTIMVFLKTDTGGGCTIDGSGAEQINGSSTYSLLTKYDSVRLLCDGTEWFAIAVTP